MEQIKIGIYKIISPSGRIYIGQAVDILHRWKRYGWKDIEKQIKIYRSIKKYGLKNHIFEVVEECLESELNERERYWQDYYDVLGPKGLNCKLTKVGDKSGRLSEETKKRMSESNTKPNLGKKASAETRKKMSENNTRHNKGVPRTDETKRKLSQAHKGKKHTEETKAKLRENGYRRTGIPHKEESKKKMSINNPKIWLGKKFSQEHLANISKALKGRKRSEEIKKKMRYNSQSKIILNIETGIYYMCIRDAAESISMDRKHFNNYLLGKYKTKTIPFIYA